MNREEILAMEAGRELDKLIHEKVFGWTRMEYPAVPAWQKPTKEGTECWHAMVPHYSTYTADAYEVVEKMKEKYFMVSVIAVKGGQYECIITSEEPTIHNDYELYELGETAPLAICRAALLAVMEGEK